MTSYLKGETGTYVEHKNTFIRNGSMLLEQLVSVCDGKCQPIRSYSAKELKAATNNYDSRLIIKVDAFYTLYKGLLLDRPVCIKKLGHTSCSQVVNEIVFASIFSAHKNVLKLLGCCLETEMPVLVFESAENGTLLDRIFYSDRDHVQPIPWKCRLKIAVDLSNAVAYLHNVFPKPIIHRNIKTTTILINEHNTAKLSEFLLAIAIPDGEYEVEDDVAGTIGYIAPEYLSTGHFNEKIDVFGTIGYIAPEYLSTGHFNEKIDVFSVGGVLLEVLTGKRMFDSSRIDEEIYLQDLVMKYVEEHRLNEIVDPKVLEEGPWPGKEQQLQDFARIALECRRDVEDRPTMMEVAKRLREIFQSLSLTN